MKSITNEYSTPTRRKLFWTAVLVSTVLSIVMLVLAQWVSNPPGVPAGAVSLPRMRPSPVTAGDLLRTLSVGSLAWYACFFSAPLLLLLARSFPFDRAHWKRSLVAHVVVVLLLTVVTAWLQYIFTFRGQAMAPPLGAYLQVGLLTGTLPFVTVVALVHAVDGRVRAHERAIENERMRTQLAESRLDALTAQLQPHFLFNTLQGISTLIRKDAAAADRMLLNLSDLLREVLTRGQERSHHVLLQEELRVLDSYLEISQKRFGERLTIVLDIDDGVRSAFVPFFILQPLVENALHHGIGSHAGSGTVRIAAYEARAQLILSVTDDGPGVQSPDASRGIGLTNTRERLNQLYGSSYALETGRRPEGGFMVTIAVPLSRAASSAQST